MAEEPARRWPPVAPPANRPAGGAPMTALERLAARLAAAPPAPLARPGATVARPGAPAPLAPPGAPVARPGVRAVPPAPAAPSSFVRPAAAPTRPTGQAAPPRIPAPATRPPGALAPRPTLPRPAAPAGAIAIPGAPGALARRAPSTALPTTAEIESAVDHAAYERFAAEVRQLLGFDLTQYKRPQVWRRANSFAKQHGCADVHVLVERCRADAGLKVALRDMITINVSEFFRNPEAWDALRATVLPDLVTLGRPIRFWSAGCSLGYEPYTFAMLVREAGLGADARIQATDLDETILAQARASAYAEHQMVGVSRARRSRFFEERDGLAVVKADLRAMVQWRRHDLLRDPFPADQDLIACRNVVIYFTDDAKSVLYRNFARALRMGGVLFIGATEAIPGPRAFGLELVTSGIYRRIA
jgi:chemotaxis protein methyltransferase CheR